jgi:hypothetical protein
MNMPALSPTEPAAALVPPINTGPRRLADDVFQSAEEAVLVEGQGNSLAGLPLRSAVPADTRQGFPFARALRRQVAARPCQSALLAIAAGALAMMALRSRLRGRLPPPRP